MTADLFPDGTRHFDLDVPFRPGSDHLSPGEARRLVAAALVRPVLADVLVAADQPDSCALRAAAAALLLPAAPPEGWAVGFASAAWIYTGWWVGPGPPSVLDVVIPPGRRRCSTAGLRVRQVALVDSDVVMFCGVPVTTPIRTAADVARSIQPEQALRALERLGRSSGVRPDQVLARLRDMPSSRGVVPARRLVRNWSRSELPTPAGDPVGVEDTLDPTDGGDQVPEVRGIGHLERELRDGHPIP